MQFPRIALRGASVAYAVENSKSAPQATSIAALIAGSANFAFASSPCLIVISQTNLVPGGEATIEGIQWIQFESAEHFGRCFLFQFSSRAEDSIVHVDVGRICETLLAGQYLKAKYPHGRLHGKTKYYNVATSIMFEALELQ